MNTKQNYTFVYATCAIMLGLGLVLSGCAGKLTGASKANEAALVIPDFPVAQQQYQFAKAYQNSLLIAPDVKRRRIQMEKIGQCYYKVMQNFPNDPVYVPLSYLELGDCAAQSDEMDKAISFYQQAQASSQEEFIQARAEYSVGRIKNTQGKFAEAKTIFKSIMDRYGKSESGKVRDVVNRSAQLYLSVVDPSETVAKTNKQKQQEVGSPALNF